MNRFLLLFLSGWILIQPLFWAGKAIRFEINRAKIEQWISGPQDHSSKVCFPGVKDKLDLKIHQENQNDSQSSSSGFFVFYYFQQLPSTFLPAMALEYQSLVKPMVPVGQIHKGFGQISLPPPNC